MFTPETVLKEDAFGSIEKGRFQDVGSGSRPAIRRVYTSNPWLRPFALILARNERKAIKRLAAQSHTGYFPDLLAENRDGHVRSFIEGHSMHHATEHLSAAYFDECQDLLEAMHKTGVCNNDLAKEANWLVTPEGKPAITDFQLALRFRNQVGRLFLSLTHDDLRHMLKHKRKYGQVRGIELEILSRRSLVNQLWMNSGKRLHRFITRRFLGWEERNGPGERGI